MTSFILTCLMFFPATIIVVQSPGYSQSVRGSQVSTTEALMKARIIDYERKKRPLTIKLKSGAVYWIPGKSGSFTADKNVKFSGTVLASDDDSFIFGAYEGFLPHYVDWQNQYRISYRDIESLRVNMIPDEMKGIGEGLFCIFVLSWAGADCEP